MRSFDIFISDAASRFGLGDKVGSLLRELMKLVAETPGGLAGFVDKFRAAGFSGEVSRWLGNPNASSLSLKETERVFGRGTIESIARKVGIPPAAASSALGYIAPKLIGWLTPGGVIEPGIPRSAAEFMSVPESGAVTASPFHRRRRAYRRASPYELAAARPFSPLALVLPLLAALAAGGLAWYVLSGPATTLVATTSPDHTARR